MTELSTDFCFTSNLFQVEPGEDEETNPYRYGKQLSHWLAGKLAAAGYPEAEVIPEDWGWCVMCSRDPFMLWVGCGNQDTDETLENPELIRNQPIIWRCFVVAEVPFWKRILGKPDTESSERNLSEQLQGLLTSEAQIRMVECP